MLRPYPASEPATGAAMETGLNSGSEWVDSFGQRDPWLEE
jgi:hypothetical protein